MQFKSLAVILGAALMVASPVFAAPATRTCGSTEVAPADVEQALSARVAAARSARTSGSTSDLAFTSASIPVYYHVITDGTNGRLTSSQIKLADLGAQPGLLGHRRFVLPRRYRDHGQLELVQQRQPGHLCRGCHEERPPQGRCQRASTSTPSTLPAVFSVTPPSPGATLRLPRTTVSSSSGLPTPEVRSQIMGAERLLFTVSKGEKLPQF
ncbi:hypothetical protein L1887_59877 [Cichorium endivia]|nr:hypothetical protein L1887_59877 [Cichorium endivia]